MRSSLIRFEALESRIVSRLNGRCPPASGDSTARFRPLRPSPTNQSRQLHRSATRPQNAVAENPAFWAEDIMPPSVRAPARRTPGEAGAVTEPALFPTSGSSEGTRSPAQSRILDALQRHDPEQLLQALLNGSGNVSLPKPLPLTTWNEIFRVLDPHHFLEEYKDLHDTVSAAKAERIGVKSVRDVFEDFTGKIRAVLWLRRETGQPLGVLEYTFLLDCARVIGDGPAAAVLWEDMKRDGVEPDARCYHHYIAAKCWSGAYFPEQRHKLRVIPFNQTMQSSNKPPPGTLQIKVGEGGVEEDVLRVFEEMIRRGFAADEQSFSLLLLAMAREGDMAGVAAVLKRAWNVDVEALLARAEPDWPPVTPYSKSSPLHPSSHLLYAIVHAYGSNNNMPLALRMVDYLSRQYSIAIPHPVWDELFTWTFVLSVPRHGPRKTDGTMAGNLPLVSVSDLWRTMRGEPYNVQPTMPMYNRYIRNLFLREKVVEARQRMDEALALYHASLRAHRAAERRLKHAEETAAADKPDNGGGASLEQMRRRADFARWTAHRDFLYVHRWVRLLLGVRARRGQNYGWERREVPQIMRQWRDFLPARVWYKSSTGKVDLSIRRDERRPAPFESWRE